MSQAARKIQPSLPGFEPAPVAAPAARDAAARVASLDDIAHASPALALQEQLHARVALTANGKWSYRRTFAFLLIANGAFWLAAGFLVSRLF